MASRRQPVGALCTLLLALAAHMAWRASQPVTPPGGALPAAPPVAALRLASGGETAAASRAVMLQLQALDDPAGAHLAWRRLDYATLRDWLALALDLDPRSQYPLLAASQVYSAVADAARTRLMLDFVEHRFVQAPAQRWPWLLEARLAARYRLHDEALAGRYAALLQAAVPPVPPWAPGLAAASGTDELAELRTVSGARQLHGALRDPNEARRLAQRLQRLETERTIQPAHPAQKLPPE